MTSPVSRLTDEQLSSMSNPELLEVIEGGMNHYHSEVCTDSEPPCEHDQAFAELACRLTGHMLKFERKLKQFAADTRWSNEFIGIFVRSHFSTSGGVATPAGMAADPDLGSVRSASQAEVEKLTPAVPRGLTAFCASNRHTSCPGAYREHGDGQLVFCPCECHHGTASGIPELIPEEDLDADWNLCCYCGTITAETKWTYWHRPLEEEETPGAFDEWVTARPGEGDPMCLCPTCGWEHVDTDDGSGYYSGTWDEMSGQRRRDLPEYGEWWASRLEEHAKENQNG